MVGVYRIGVFTFIAAQTSITIVNAFSSSSTQPKASCVVKICHNKECIKHGGGEQLLNTFRDLLPGGGFGSDTNISVERSGCLSHCAKGPNVAVMQDDKKEQLFFGVKDSITASAVLDVATGEELPIELLVAATSIAEAQHATSVDKKEEILSITIADLSKKDLSLRNSFAHAHALFLRADARLDKSPADINGAIHDATLASQLASSDRKVWRVLSNALEASGDIVEAINAVRICSVVDPSFTTKAKKEIERLQLLLP